MPPAFRTAGRQPDLPVHRQRRKPHVVAIEVVQHVGHDQERHQSPGNLGEGATLDIWRGVLLVQLSRFVHGVQSRECNTRNRRLLGLTRCLGLFDATR